jgi:hypothetical protein
MERNVSKLLTEYLKWEVCTGSSTDGPTPIEIQRWKAMAAPFFPT